MKRIIPIILSVMCIAILFTACDSNHQSMQESVASSADYTSEETNNLGAHRKIIKTAAIDLQVEQLEKAVLDLKKFLKPIKGYVYNYEIDNQSYHSDSYQKNMDSMVSVEEIIPRGSLSIRIPIAQADSFINYVLNSGARINSLRINDDDITENLWEKKQVAQVYSKTARAKKHKGTSKNISYDNSNSISAIQAKAMAAKMKYQTKYLWFNINMTAQPYYKSITTMAAKNYRTPIYISFANALVKGWHICADIILALITVWPLWLLIGLCGLAYKRYRPNTN